MKITKQRLKQIIREEIEALTEEECGENDNDCREEARAKAARAAGRDAEYKVHEGAGLNTDEWNDPLPRKRFGMKFIKDEDEEERLTQDITVPFEKAGELAGQAVGLPGRLARGTKKLKNKFSQGYRKGLTKEGTDITSKDFKDMIRAELRAIVSETGGKR